MVTLHPLTPVDLPELIAANRASAALHHPWVNPPVSPDAFDAAFEDIAAERQVTLLAREVGTSALSGVLNLSQIFRKGFQNAYLGFYGLTGQTGRGLMTKAVRQTLAHAFGPLALHRIEANVQPGNTRSRALIARAGFRQEGFSPRYLQIEGEWRDHERWACLAEDFAA